MSNESISCIVPVFNGKRFLRDALDSILAQTRPPEEIVVVDDGSTDGSARIVQEYGGRIRYFYQENRGPAAARNVGLGRSCGEFVAFLDQDDLWHPEKLERQTDCFKEEPDADLCLVHAELRWMADLEAEERVYARHPRGKTVPAYTTPAMLARRSAFVRVGPLDERLLFGDAADWLLRAMDFGLKINVLPDVLLYHRMHGSNLTRQRERSKREFVRVVKSTLDRRRNGTMPGAGGTGR